MPFKVITTFKLYPFAKPNAVIAYNLKNIVIKNKKDYELYHSDLSQLKTVIIMFKEWMFSLFNVIYYTLRFRMQLWIKIIYYNTCFPQKSNLLLVIYLMRTIPTRAQWLIDRIVRLQMEPFSNFCVDFGPPQPS